jgi:glycine dehydrogenase subunit 1
MPGRITGQTTDVDGKRGFVLTLKTREQDIRRERATSNICTNQTLCATAATVYMAALGPEGLREVCELNLANSRDALEAVTSVDGVTQAFSGATFNEFVVRTVRPAADVLASLREKGIGGGIDLGRFYPELSDCVLTCVTETKRQTDIDCLAAAWGEIL